MVMLLNELLMLVTEEVVDGGPHLARMINVPIVFKKRFLRGANLQWRTTCLSERSACQVSFPVRKHTATASMVRSSTGSVGLRGP